MIHVKLLNINLEEQHYDLKVVPAPLHDVAEEVYGDKLYSMYTVTNTVIDNDIHVGIVASDLVKHTAANGQKGYWVGVGITYDLITDATVYVGWGTLPDEELLTMVHTNPDGEYLVGDQKYATYYFDVANAADHDDTASIVVEKNGIHYHYLLDFSMVTMVTSVAKLDSMAWDAVSVQTVKDNYLFGINLADQQGNPLPESLFVHYLNAAVDYMQNYLDIIISPTLIENEQHDYIRNDYQNWGFIQLNKNPVREVKSLRLMYGNSPSIDIPLDWIKLNRLTGQITLFPSAGSASSLIIGQTGLLMGFWGYWSYAPSLWEVTYEAGMDENDPSIPYDLLREAIFKRASMGILNVWGEPVCDVNVA